MRFVLISFAFLGFAFYELSGGADFEPRGVRPAQPEKLAYTPAPKPKPVAEPVTAVALVAKPALTPRKAKTVEPEPVAAPELTSDEAAQKLAQLAPGFQAGLNGFGENVGAGLTLASLQQGATSLQRNTEVTEPQVAEPEQPKADIREILGTRVNMRDGPGTIYPVVGRLNIGHQVEVLGESGTGWLRLRVLPEQQMGWIAASLVSKKTP
ncbi:Bacterial SH3 domain protein [Falsiruegeria litorea R37]|uniref:Bacterial SH3 domain protein n=1 Tax=Falsiruegeria litorea R37 TaxID=1200284 RepID=A0A1Y5RQR6_9RHOB|nr:SH3 domain-containing protein [Falsiruegeria litorea]SLN22244.1 Bacterial SH3 domain protein [Falsiruegeria litorea R37]